MQYVSRYISKCIKKAKDEFWGKGLCDQKHCTQSNTTHSTITTTCWIKTLLFWYIVLDFIFCFDEKTEKVYVFIDLFLEYLCDIQFLMYHDCIMIYWVYRIYMYSSDKVLVYTSWCTFNSLHSYNKAH